MRGWPCGTAEYTSRDRLEAGFVRYMLLGGEVSIISSVDCEERMRVVKQSMQFESGPDWIATLS